MVLLKSVVKSYPQLELHKEELNIKSLNGKKYKICIKTGVVMDSSGQELCVVAASSYDYPRSDIILSKALTIAFAPNEIYTL